MPAVRQRRAASGRPEPRLDPEQLLDGLNGPQRDAVTHAGSPLLIVAGAGSGKTRVLTHRIAYLLAERHVHPGEIIAITFTNKAAGEMKERVAHLVGPRARLMWVSTFHSACVRILRAEHEHAGLKSTFSIYDADDSRRLMQLVARELDLDPKRYTAARPGRPGVQPEERAGRAGGVQGARAKGPNERAVAEAYELYQRRLREAHALDFDDIIMATVHLLQSHPHVAEAYRRRFRHVLVDEYQDTNHAQYMLVKELVGAARRRAAAGRAVRGRRRRPVDLRVPRRHDPQHPGVRARLPRRPHHPAGAELPLHPDDPVRGQRGDRPQHVAQAQAAVERPGRRRADRRATSPTPSTPRPTGWPARSTGSPTDDEVRPGDVAVFYRTNAQSRVFEEVFIRVGLPYKVVGGVRFYERKEVRDALGYLRAVVNDDDTVSIRRVLNTPQTRHRRPGRGVRRGAVHPRPHLVRPGAAARQGRAGHRDPRGQQHRRVRAAARRPAGARRRPRRPRRCWRRCCSGPACSASWRRASTRRTRAGWKTCRSW